MVASDEATDRYNIEELEQNNISYLLEMIQHLYQY